MKANIVRIEKKRLGSAMPVIEYYVAYLDRPVGMLIGEAKNYIYCMKATDEISAYTEAQEYLANWFYGVSR